MHTPFTHIESLANVARTVQRGESILAPVDYVGTVKLHGTNGGVRVSADGTVRAQSRNRSLTLEDDHMGFAAFVYSRFSQFQLLAREISWNDVVLYGEWIGPGVQKEVGLSQLPEKQFVIFAAKYGEDQYAKEKQIEGLVPYLAHGGRVRCIHEVKSYRLLVDFMDPEQVLYANNMALRMAQEVEEQCPWAKMFGIEGIGEGIVWKPLGNPDSTLFFKSKGEKHRNTSAKPKVISGAGVARLVEFAVTDVRLAQGVEVLKELNEPITQASTGKYLKWVCQDIQRECAAEIEEWQVNWKGATRAISKLAREYFFRVVRDEEFPGPEAA